MATMERRVADGEPETRSAASYAHWVASAAGLLEPLTRLMQSGTASLPLNGPASNHGTAADLLESFARPCLLAAHWLAADDQAEARLSKSRLASWFREGMVAGTNPEGREYWGPTAPYHQHTVEMGALVLALEIAPHWLWAPLKRSEKNQIALWLMSVRGSGFHRNNHLFFGVLPLSFLIKYGYGNQADCICVAKWLDVLEGMALGGGWFIDGMNETVDHYNAFAFHYYGLWWVRLHGENDPTRAKRWREWTGEFLADYVHFFAASGEPVPFGRSLSYRFAASAPFALAEMLGVSPLPPGQARRLCTRCLDFFLDHDITQDQGALGLGWTDTFSTLAEAYSCAGSPYWAAKAFAPLLIPPNAPFWTQPEAPLPSEEGDFSRPLASIGMVVRGDQGEVELLNGSSGICPGNTAFGISKWGKFSYRTGVGFELETPGTGPPLDAGLTAESLDGVIYSRQATHALEVSNEQLACTYALGDRHTRFCVQVESHIWWRGGWQFHLHSFVAHQPTCLRLGASSLAAAHRHDLHDSGTFPYVTATNGVYGVALQALAGFTTAGLRSSSEAQIRTHLLGENCLTVFVRTAFTQGTGLLAALTQVGPATEAALPWEIEESLPGRISLRQAGDKLWTISHPALSFEPQKLLTP